MLSEHAHALQEGRDIRHFVCPDGDSVFYRLLSVISRFEAVLAIANFIKSSGYKVRGEVCDVIEAADSGCFSAGY